MKAFLRECYFLAFMFFTLLYCLQYSFLQSTLPFKTQLKGQVIECTPTFITLTTNHILSTKISTENLHRQGFFYNSTTLEWTRERDSTNNNQENDQGMEGEEQDDDNDVLGPSTSIYLDDTVEFVVERIHECGGLISLDGTHPSVSAM